MNGWTAFLCIVALFFGFIGGVQVYDRMVVSELSSGYIESNNTIYEVIEIELKGLENE